MDLLWFFIGILIIFCIGRYNESNKLFWILLISFVGSFAVATIITKVTSYDSNGAKKKEVQVCNPTQASNNASGIFLLADAMLGDTQSVQLKPASQETCMPELLLIGFNSPLVNSGIVYSPLNHHNYVYILRHFMTCHETITAFN